MKRNLFVIGKVHIRDLHALEQWHSSGEAKIFVHENWSKQRAESWEDHEQIGFYDLQGVIPGLSRALDYASDYHFNTLCEIAAYYQTIDQPLNLLYKDESDRFAIISGPDLGAAYVIPCHFLDIEMFEDYDALSVSEMRALGENVSPLAPAFMDQESVDHITGDIRSKEKAIKKKKEAMTALKREQEEKLEEYRRQLEEQYRTRTEALRTMQEELNAQVEELNKKLYMLESEIYAIRCLNGETVDFTRLTSGRSSDRNTQVVIYQKLRFLDEELGKWLAVYDFEGTDAELGYFEEILKTRPDMQDLFCPDEKSVSFIKISRNGVGFQASPIIANTLESYAKYHGATIAVLVRDGENLYIGWTDQDKININDDNMFYAPKKELLSADEEYETSSTQSEMLSRVFIFSVLQGLINNGTLIRLPGKASITKPSPYIVFSLADGWIEDNTYGSWEDILKESSNDSRSKNDMVLTMQHIQRDDTGYTYGRSTMHDAYNNDRGRGDKNRTHDVSIKDCTVYPINLIDKDETWKISYLDYPYAAIERKSDHVRTEYGECCSIWYEYQPLSGPPRLTVTTEEFENGAHHSYGKITDDNICGFIRWKEDYYYKDHMHRDIQMNGDSRCYRREFYKAEHIHTTHHYFISEEKKDSGYNWRTGTETKKARANMEVYDDEFLDLTYLDSVRIKYAITNRKVTDWRIGGKTVDYAMALKYLNKALEYLKKREESEKEMLLQYAEELPDNWPALLSRWRHEKGYHTLTSTRAKAFCRNLS